MQGAIYAGKQTTRIHRKTSHRVTDFGKIQQKHGLGGMGPVTLLLRNAILLRFCYAGTAFCYSGTGFCDSGPAYRARPGATGAAATVSDYGTCSARISALWRSAPGSITQTYSGRPPLLVHRRKKFLWTPGHGKMHRAAETPSAAHAFIVQRTRDRTTRQDECIR